jgi:DNA replication protein DnaC
MEKISSILSQVQLPNSETAEEKNSTSQNNKSVCIACGGNGCIEVIGKDGLKRYKRCIDCDRRRKAEWLGKTIPIRFRDCSFDNWYPKTPKQISAKAKMNETEYFGDFCLIGPYGCGKTHLLYAQFRIYCLDEPNAIFVFRTTKELIDELVSDEMDQEESIILRSIKNKSELHLFWDDADKFKVTEYKQEALFNVIDAIYRHQQGLSLSTNLNLIELQEKLSPAICRRIDDICERIEL